MRVVAQTHNILPSMEPLVTTILHVSSLMSNNVFNTDVTAKGDKRLNTCILLITLKNLTAISYYAPKNTFYWLAVWVPMVTSTVLAAMGFRGFLCARYNVTPPNL